MDRLRVSSVATMLHGFSPLEWSAVVNGMVRAGSLTADEGTAAQSSACALVRATEPKTGVRPASVRAAALKAKHAAKLTLSKGAERLEALVTPPAAATTKESSRAAKKVLRASESSATRSASDQPKRSKKKRSTKKQQQFERDQKRMRKAKRRAWADGYEDSGQEILRDALRKRVGSPNGSVRPMSYKASQTVAPRSTVRNAYVALFGSPPSTEATFTKAEREEMHAKIDVYQIRRLGNPSWDPYLKGDDDAFVAQLVETCCQQGFPFNRKALASLVVKIATAHGHKNVVCGKSWMKSFLARHKGRLGIYKPCAVGSDRANQASEEVRDAVFAKLNALLDVFVTRGLLTQVQRDDPAFLAPLISNMDEIGLDFTKRWESIIGSKQARKNAKKLRRSVVMQTDPTHVPFHVSVALTSRADGTFCPVQLLIHQGMVRVSTTCVCSSLVTVDVTQRACGRGARQGVGVGRGAGGSAEGDEGRGRRRGAALTTSPLPLPPCPLKNCGERDVEGLDERASWSVACTANGSMELEVFNAYCHDFVKFLPADQGTGGLPHILTMDGHSSRWTYEGLSFLLSNNAFPFVFASKTSLFAQPNDNGINKSVETCFNALMDKWRMANVHLPYTRACVNSCFVAAIGELELRYKKDLASTGTNVITRAFLRTGVCPVNSKCERWTEAIAQLGIAANPTSAQLAAEVPTVVRTPGPDMSQVMRFQVMGDRDIVLQKITYDLVKNHFAAKVDALKKSMDEAKSVKRKNYGVPNSKRGLNVMEVMSKIEKLDKAREQKAESKAATVTRRKKALEVKAVKEAALAATARALVVDTSTSVDARINSLKPKTLMAALLRSVDVAVETNAKRPALVALMHKQFGRSSGGQRGRAQVFGKWKHAAPTI